MVKFVTDIKTYYFNVRKVDKRIAMKSRCPFLIICVCAISLALCNCRKNGQKPISEDFFITRILQFYIKDDVSNKNLIGTNGEPFLPDSIRITLMAGTAINSGSAMKDSAGKYLCSILYLEQPASKEDDINNIYIDEAFYVHLSQYDTDTLSVKKAANQQIRFYYNNIFLDSIVALEKKVPLLIVKK